VTELRGRVREIVRNRELRLVVYSCRAPTLSGVAVDFEFTLGMGDERTRILQRGSRVFYSTHNVSGAWGFVTLLDDGRRIPVDKSRSTKVEATGGGPASYREAAMFEAAPELALKQRVQRDAARMGFDVSFGIEEGQAYVEVAVPGRGTIKHYKDIAATWEEVLDGAGLGGTIR
jgi:hypothetical protein